MFRVRLAVLFVFAVAGAAFGFDAVGTIKKVDAEKNTLLLNANGKDRTVPVAADAKVLDAQGKPLRDGLKAKELAEGTEVTVTVEQADGRPVIVAIRLGKPAGPVGGKASFGLTPLTEMSATDRYKGEEGGLY